MYDSRLVMILDTSIVTQVIAMYSLSHGEGMPKRQIKVSFKASWARCFSYSSYVQLEKATDYQMHTILQQQLRDFKIIKWHHRIGQHERYMHNNFKAD